MIAKRTLTQAGIGNELGLTNQSLFDEKYLTLDINRLLTALVYVLRATLNVFSLLYYRFLVVTVFLLDRGGSLHLKRR